MDSFDMPHLSKYFFYSTGSCWNKFNGHPVRPIKHKGKFFYHIINDDGKLETVRKDEIIQYGKHVASIQPNRDNMRQYVVPEMYDVRESKINF